MIKKYKEFIGEAFDGNSLIYMSFDMDDNLLFLETPIYMDHKEGDQWVPHSVSTEKFAVVRSDPQWRIRNNDPKEAFVEFRDFGVRGNDTFLEDFKKAVTEKKFAPSWTKFIECLVNGYIFAIITSRGHKPDNVHKAIEWLLYEYGIDNFRNLPLKGVNTKVSLEDQMIRNLLAYHELFGTEPGFVIEEYLKCCPIYTVSSPDFAKQFGELPVEQAKKVALRDFTVKANKYARDLGCRAKISFSDDDPKFVKSAIDEFSDLIKDYGDMEFSVFDTGEKRNKIDI